MSSEAYSIKFHSSQSGTPSGPLNLSMFIGQNSFMFATFAQNYTSVTELAHVQLNMSHADSDTSGALSGLINNFLLHQKKFDKVQLTLLSSDFTIVPESFASETNTKTLLKFATGFSEPAVTRHHNLSGLSFYYAINQPLISYVENTFRNISIRHAGAVSINLALSHHSLQNTHMFLNIHDSCLELTLKESNKLVFYNNFKFENHEDVLYFLLFTMEQFELNPLHIKLSVAGQIDATGDLASSIKRYIKQVSFCTHHTSIKLEADLNSLPSHHYFTLLNQHVCEL